MSPLVRKTLRDLWRSRLLFGAIVLLLATGLALFASMYSAFKNLEASEAFTYEELRFADLTVRVSDSLPDVVDLVAALPGVEDTESRRVVEAGVFRPDGSGATVLARVMTVPDSGRPTVNDVSLRSGSYFSSESRDSVMVDDQFADHYGLKPGDTLAVVIETGEIELTVAGTFTSPEYIWKAKSSQEPFVGRGEFAVLLMPRRQLASVLGDDLVNEVVLRLSPAANGAQVESAVAGALSEHGFVGATRREDQVSYALLKLDLDGFGEIAVVVPAMFLVITALIIHTLLSRTIRSQRTLIGLMRAVGFSRGSVLRHYLAYPVVIAVAGGIIGTAVGMLLGGYLTDLYVDVVGIPFSVVESQLAIAAVAILIGLSVCTVAGLAPALSAARLAPSESMRPVVPGARLPGRLTLRLGAARLPYTIRLALRNIVRARGRTLSSLFAVALAVGLVIAAVGLLDSMNHAFSVHFDEIQRYDLKATFSGLAPDAKIDELGSLDGVARVEPILELPVVLGTDAASVDTVLTALPADSALMRLKHARGAQPLAGDGLFLSGGLAATLDVAIGDRVRLAAASVEEELPVAGVVDQPLASAVFIPLSQARQLIGADVATAALIGAERPEQLEKLGERLNADSAVLAVERSQDVRAGFEELMGLFYQFVGIFVWFGISLGAIAAFNMVTLNIIERRRELATMRSLGFSSSAIDGLLTVENMVVGTVGVLLGFAVGYVFVVEMLTLFESELFRLDPFVATRTYVIVGLASVVVLLLSELPGVRAVHRTDLAAATKELVG